MRVPLSWLREFVPVEVDPEQLAERLSLSGLAVEQIVRTGAGIGGVVVGEVRAVREHPNADSLMLVRAFDGAVERDIVCGARNYVAGDRVPLALPGARLPDGTEIQQRRVRGETSDGMLCSARELRIADDHSGILILDRDAEPGADLVSALGLDDIVLDLDVTPNRPDCLSIVGVAREVAALYGLPLTVSSPAPQEEAADVETLATVRVEDARGCPRYLARVVEGVSTVTSPWWMRRRILAAGMRPISAVVDVTNYVLLERGQPLHAFDLDTLAERTIVVRRPRKGERITTLDGQVRELAREDVAICDAERPVAVAGVMGGAETEVTEKTQRVLLESAWFDPGRIARTARRLGLRTEASVRFERGSDPEAVPAAAALAAKLLAEIAGGRVARGAIDVYSRPPRARTIKLRVARAATLTGLDLTGGEIASLLAPLGCDVEASRTALRVVPPTHRPDLSIEEDLVEEIARLAGYDRVPERLPPGARTGGFTERQQLRRRAREILLGAGLSEAQTLSLIPRTFADRARLAPDHPARRAAAVANPLSEDESLLRPSLAPGLLLAAERNAARRVLPVRLFEIGTAFGRGIDHVDEWLEVGWVLAGQRPQEWHTPARDLDFFDCTGVLETLVSGLAIDDWSLHSDGLPDDRLLHPGRGARVVVGGADVGFVGEVHPAAADALSLPPRTSVAWLRLDPLLDAAGRDRAGAVPRLPAVGRDIALIVPAGTPASVVRARIHEAGGTLLERARLFDHYDGPPIPEGHTSLAWTLTIRASDRTLTDQEADAVIAAIVSAAARDGWSVRD